MLVPLAILADIGAVLIIAIEAVIGSLRLAPAYSPSCLLSPLTQLTEYSLSPLCRGTTVRMIEHLGVVTISLKECNRPPTRQCRRISGMHGGMVALTQGCWWAAGWESCSPCSHTSSCRFQVKPTTMATAMGSSLAMRSRRAKDCWTVMGCATWMGCMEVMESKRARRIPTVTESMRARASTMETASTCMWQAGWRPRFLFSTQPSLVARGTCPFAKRPGPVSGKV